jgi:ATP-dependent Clp protease adapter protein ClpS
MSITTDIHTNGSAVVAVLPYEIAEQKSMEVMVDARGQGFPLQTKIELEA